jgi:hypothetical protein
MYYFSESIILSKSAFHPASWISKQEGWKPLCNNNNRVFFILIINVLFALTENGTRFWMAKDHSMRESALDGQKKTKNNYVGRFLANRIKCQIKKLSTWQADWSISRVYFEGRQSIGWSINYFKNSCLGLVPERKYLEQSTTIGPLLFHDVRFLLRWNEFLHLHQVIGLNPPD